MFIEAGQLGVVQREIDVRTSGPSNPGASVAMPRAGHRVLALADLRVVLFSVRAKQCDRRDPKPSSPERPSM